jgi:hypothetical protein
MVGRVLFFLEREQVARSPIPSALSQVFGGDQEVQRA